VTGAPGAPGGAAAGAQIVETATVYANQGLAPGIYSLTLDAPRIAPLARPGQFVHLGLGLATAGQDSPHPLRRPFSVYQVGADRRGDFQRLTLLYQTIGSGTLAISRLQPGDAVSLLGPLGRGWQPPVATRRALLVGGGVGFAPLALLAGALMARSVEVHALVGARNLATLNALLGGGLACLPYPDRTQDALLDARHFIHLATDDGSAGYHGLNVGLLSDLLAQYDFDYIAACGPEPMQRAVALAARQHSIYCEVSLERHMACGIGACLSCIVQTGSGTQRACLDGPVFDAQEVVW